MKKLVSILLITALLTVSFTGCAKKTDTSNKDNGGNKIRVGVSVANFDDTFFTYLMDGMKEFAGKYDDLEIELVDAKEDMAKQMDQVDNFVVQQKDAIVIIPVDTSAADPMIKTCADAKIPAVFVNRSPSSLPEGTYYVGSEAIISGRLQMEYLAELMGGKGNLTILQGKLDNEATHERTLGNEEILENYPDIKILDKQTGLWQRSEGMKIAEDWLNRYGSELNAIACNNDDMALGAIQALKDAGRSDVLVVGIDATPDALASMEEGNLKCTVFQDAAGQGAGSIEVAYKLGKKESVEKETMIPYVLVTPEDIADYK